MMLKTLSQLAGSKTVLATALLGLITSSQAIVTDASGKSSIELTVKTDHPTWGNAENGQVVRVELGAFPLDKRLLAGDLTIPESVLVTEVTMRYNPEEQNDQCVVLRADQNLGDLPEANTLPFRVNLADRSWRGLRIFCAELDDTAEAPFFSVAGADEDEW